MIKVLSLIIFLLWSILLFFISALIIYSFLSIFVTIRNSRILNDFYNRSNLSWLTEDGKYKSLRQRIQISKERTKITKELINSENKNIKNKVLFRVLMNINSLIIIVRKIVIVLFVFLIALHIIAYIL